MSEGRHKNILEADRAGLFIVDVQERFRPVMDSFDEMLAGCLRALRTFQLLERPVFVTEQYPKGLGQTVPELRHPLGDSNIPEKLAFSGCGAEPIPDAIQAAGVSQMLVVGIETHVCVNQTVHDLLHAGLQVHVAADAVGSRHDRNKRAGLRKMKSSGAVITSTEMAAFEMLHGADHPQFKAVQALYK